MKRKLTRRDFLRWSAAATGAILAACAPATPVVVEKEVVKEIPVEKAVIVEKEVVKEVVKEVPKEVIKEVEIPVTVTPKPVEVVHLDAYLSTWGAPMVRISNELVGDFNRRHPYIEIEISHIPADLGAVEAMMTRVAAGDFPDVVIPLEYHFQFLDAGYLMVLDPFINADPDFSLDDYYPRLVEFFQDEKGKQIGIPIQYATEIFYYNKRMFDEEAIDYPDETWTWEDDVLEAAKRLTKDLDGDGKPDQWGFSFRNRRIDAYVFAWGGRYVDEEAGKCLMDEPESIAAHQFLADCMYEYEVTPTAADMAGVAGGHRTLFTSDRCAMLTDAEHGVRTFNAAVEEEGLEYDVALIPKGPVERATQYYPGGNVIFSTTEYPEAAWEALKFFAGDEYLRAVLVFYPESPPAKISVNEFKWLEYIEAPEHREVFVENPQYGRVPFFLRRHGKEIRDIIFPGLDPMWLGKKSATEVADEICPKVEERFAELMGS